MQDIHLDQEEFIADCRLVVLSDYLSVKYLEVRLEVMMEEVGQEVVMAKNGDTTPDDEQPAGKMTWSAWLSA